MLLAALLCIGPMLGGCASVRTTDPTRTATEQYLMSTAAQRAIAQLSCDGLRDRLAYVDISNYAAATTPQDLYLVGELRARLLREGVRLTPIRNEAEIIVELRGAGLGVDRYEYLLGIPASALAGTATGTSTGIGGVPVTTPDLAILKSTKQKGYASVAIVAYRSRTGEMITQSGPFIGKTLREDFWIFGFGPKTVGNIPPAE
jgi:hypothetical protein